MTNGYSQGISFFLHENEVFMNRVRERKKSDMTAFCMTAVYSLLHLLVDGVCAYAMFGTFLEQPQGYDYVLLYNFCAFALQMPLGAALDILNPRRGKALPFLTACMGVVLTLAGALTHPALLGIGNALFHIGGGVGTICEDAEKDWRGRGLGVFVAPGALGLYLGMRLAGSGAGIGWLWGTGAFMLLVCAGAAGRAFAGSPAHDPSNRGMHNGAADLTQKEKTRESVLLTVCVLLVVILRSHIGMAVTFSWKTTALAGLLCTLAVVSGKVAGGFLAAGFGPLKTAVLSLAAAAVCYLFSGHMILGIAALFLFNMTMPVTLYLLIREHPLLPGFSFGLLTFGLFLGFLPTYFELSACQNSSIIGCVGSILSLMILVCGIVFAKH